MVKRWRVVKCDNSCNKCSSELSLVIKRIEVLEAITKEIGASIRAGSPTPSLETFESVFRRPCQYCGECPVWTSAFEVESSIQTNKQLHEACRDMVERGHCDCYLRYVTTEEIGDNEAMLDKYLRLCKDKNTKETL